MIENQLKSAPSIKDLPIAKQLARLKQYSRKNNDDSDDDDNNDPPPRPCSFNLPPYYPLSPSIDEDDSDIENDLNSTQKFLRGDKPQQEKIAVAVGEKTTAALKKVRFSDYLNKLFPKADEIFNDQKIDVDDDNLPKHEITLPNTQTMFKELNDGKLTEELKFFSGGSDGGNELKFHAMQNIGMLNESNEHFLDYLSSNFAKEVLAKNKMEIRLGTGNIYYNNLNMEESIYSFMHAR